MTSRGGSRVREGLKILVVVIAAAALVLNPSEAEAKKKKKKHYYTPTVADLEKSPKYAAFVAEPETGRVLFERRPDDERYPASLTKMMTLYEVFKALDAGEYKLTDPLRVTARASIQAPSKLGLDPGDRITVEEAIKALVVVSANDVAVAVAETLGGSEDAFAAKMTVNARAIGMTRTRFVNASGLPDDDQVSTARDMYTLARHLIEEFPHYYHYFGLQSFRWNGRRFATHNHLVGKVAGVDGMKTGYIRASGFHLVSSAKRDGHRLIAVVMGGDSSRQRDAAVRRVLDTQFAALANGGGTMVADASDKESSPTKVAYIPSGPYPRPKPGDELALQTGGGQTGGSVQPAAASAEAGSLPLAISALPSTKSPPPDLAFQAPTEAMPPDTAEVASAEGTPAAPPVLPASEGSAVAALLVPPAHASPAPPARQEIRWGIQIGAYVSAQTASTKLAAARKAAPKLLSRATQSVARVAVDETAYYRARFGPLGEAEAKRACAQLEPHGFKCFTIQEPESELASGQ